MVVLESSIHPFVEDLQLLDGVAHIFDPFFHLFQSPLFLAQPSCLFLVSLRQRHGLEADLPPSLPSLLDLPQKIFMFKGNDLLLHTERLVCLRFQFHMDVVEIPVLAIFADALPFSFFLATLSGVVDACGHRTKLTIN